ncbi:MAG: chemotaxis protein CheW [Ruminiclostridium sp.]|nr:chemotaxis protein CheW [Ruminiclostridium sp.]
MRFGGVTVAARQLVVFNVNGEEFGVDVSKVNIIEHRMDIFKVPNTPEYVEGLINLRGKVYPVFSLRKRLGMPAKDLDDDTKIIMVNTGSAIAGLIADGINEIKKVEDQDIEAAPATLDAILDGMKRKFISSIIKVENRVIMLLNLETFFTVEEPAKPKL